jgi:hypothetical protein
MALYVALFIIIVVLLGVLLHPLAFLLNNAGIDTLTSLEVLNNLKLFIADFLFWGLFGFIVLMAVVVTIDRFRWQGKRSSSKSVLYGEGHNQDISPEQVKIAVAVTAYNEAEAIYKVVQELKEQEGVVEVTVISNNSQDATTSEAMAAGARVVNEPRQGYGYACIRGLSEALQASDANVIVLTEGDGTFSARDLTNFKNYIGYADMILGTRVVPGLVAKQSQMDHFFTWGNMFIAALLRLKFWESQFLGRARLTDVGCTYRAIRRDALEKILPHLVVGGDHFSLHMMLVALDHGLSIVEIPVTFRQRIGKSKGASRSIWTGLKVGLAMIWHEMTFRRNQL